MNDCSRFRELIFARVGLLTYAILKRVWKQNSVKTSAKNFLNNGSREHVNKVGIETVLQPVLEDRTGPN